MKRWHLRDGTCAFITVKATNKKTSIIRNGWEADLHYNKKERERLINLSGRKNLKG